MVVAGAEALADGDGVLRHPVHVIRHPAGRRGGVKAGVLGQRILGRRVEPLRRASVVLPLSCARLAR